ncbi:hypothetical protein [Roseateles koreensis]|uniref:Nickel-dependent hydrogenase n=1 Tax=Roseateles koreensis TaxID=2987526 RepID=A0ABT5KT94_9BURK|nr:hypothetical protein [Roseateles koreensis]MDC8786139.1 hypothetical protein [Roseateles koreensis]
MSSLSGLGGSLQVRPGQPCPHNLRSSRRDWAGRLTIGLPAAAVPQRLASMYGLCAHAQSLCASLCVAAAQGRLTGSDGAARRALQWETAREHLRRILLGWQLGLHLLPCSLLSASQPEPAQLLAWLEKNLLAMPATTWLSEWSRDPQACLRQWSEEGGSRLARLFAKNRASADQPLAGAPQLRPHASSDDLHELALCMQTQPQFCLRPLWRGACAETGPWTRLNNSDPALTSVWLRLGARLAELLRLALPGDTGEPGQTGADYLQAGQLSLGPGQGLAWVEMARGLLVHRVVLDATARVNACQVLAPTEWNFHAEGAVAQALAAMPSTLTPWVLRDARLLMSAYDPCVSVEIVEQPIDILVAAAQGAPHA